MDNQEDDACIFEIIFSMNSVPLSIQQLSLKCSDHKNRIELLRETSENGEKILRKYDSYYLPTVLKIVMAYANAINAKSSGESFRSLEKSSVETMTTYNELCQALEDHLLAGDSDMADIEATTLKSIASLDGLTPLSRVGKRSSNT